MPSITKFSLVAAALAASASAHSNNHGHLHRNIHQRHAAEEDDCGTVTLTKTVWVQPSSTASQSYCGVKTETKTIYGTSPAPAPSSSSYKASSTSVYVASSKPKPSSSSYVVPSSPPAPKPSNSYNGGSASITPNGNKWAMTYTPYNADGTCKVAEDVDSDLAKIASKGFTTVRVYSTDCSGVINVGKAADNHGLKMIVGVWIDGEGLGSKTDKQVQDLSDWGRQNNWAKVEMVVVGNEAIFNNWISAGDLANYITTVKNRFKSEGYNGVVTTTEPINIIKANGATLCPAVDVIAANIHPFFNAETSAADAGTLVANTMTDLAAVCNNSKDAYNLETGWPTQGDANGAAVPSYDNQKTAIDAIMSSAGKHSVFFSYADDPWKPAGDFNVEQHWGCSNAV